MKRALITGASSGIGIELVRRFVREGVFVHATYNSSRAAADEITAELGSDKVVFHRLDIADPGASRALAAGIDALDCLVNNAGVGTATVRKLSDDNDEQDELLLRVNALGPMWLTAALLPKLCANEHSVIVNVSSVGGGIFHFPGFRHADGMSKAALTFYSRQLAAELVHSPVNVFTVCPGAVDTPMFQASTLDAMSPDQRRAFEARLPKGRIIQASEIADVCWQLTHPSSRVLHGAVIDASSGLGVAPGLLDKNHD